MSDWLSVVLLIVCGIILLIVELIFVPGTTVLGILGFAMLVGGIYMSFTRFGQETGAWVLAGSSIVSIIAIVYSLRSGTWNKFALNSSMDSKVNENSQVDMQVGQRGVTVSDLRPMGSAEFQDKFYEVQTHGNYLESGTRIEITEISDNKIIVKPI